MNNLKQNNRSGEVNAQHYCTVKIPGAEPGYTIFSGGLKGRDKYKRK